MRFHADVHLHSKYSRATSKEADLEHLALWALKKGIAVVATGDFTHPAWLAEIREKLVPAEPGLFRLRPEIEDEVLRQAPAACTGTVRFMLEVEISTIHKKDDRVRKVHHVVFVPDLGAADRLVADLSRIGNLASDGRPILGLDSRNLLEITLESGPASYLIPAHIWTPWFAALGSKSGFDSIDACYGDLAEHIFAVETGLSSDPEMNWRVSTLDRFRLVSNSDAHSPPKLGREATLYDTDLDYFAIREALRTGRGYVGTVEFFPEEGKYHADGHRKCNLRFLPAETLAHDGLCPVCGSPLTVGVLHRVNALADRPVDSVTQPATAGKVLSLVPLPEILAEIRGVGPSSKAVARDYERLLAQLGPEFAILETVPTEAIAEAAGSVLAEAISRLRAGKVRREAGYDGEYGVIRLFEPDELRRHTGGNLLFDLPPATGERPVPSPVRGKTPEKAHSLPEPLAVDPPRGLSEPRMLLDGLDDAQRAAAGAGNGPLLIVAGPGSGKTRTLTHRIAHLVAGRDVVAGSCLAITFTRRAAAEMSERLAALIPSKGTEVPVHTFHSLGLSILREHPEAAGLEAGFRIADEAARREFLMEGMNVSIHKADRLLRTISLAKRTGAAPSDEAAEALTVYRRGMAARGWVDFDDLVGKAVALLEEAPDLAAAYRERFRWIFVDEFQDVDAEQYRLVRLLAPPDADLCVIGDPNQAIYGFRGADSACFRRFSTDYPTATVIRLARNYRSSGTIVTAASQVIAGGAPDEDGWAGRAGREMSAQVTVHAARSEKAEAEFVVQAIENMIGGHSFFSIDSGRGADGAGADLSFADFAVLYRTDAPSAELAEALARSGMPFGKHGHAPLAEVPAVRTLMAELAEEKPVTGLAPWLVDMAEHLAARPDTPDRDISAAAVQQLLGLAAACGDDFDRLADAVALASEADGWDPRADRISLLTLHAAKGLEFPIVFIVGLEDGILPLHWGGRDDAAEAEERRLFYVGMTRARDRLLLCRAEKRPWNGAPRELPPSPFLEDIQAALIEHSHTAVAPRKPERQLELF